MRSMRTSILMVHCCCYLSMYGCLVGIVRFYVFNFPFLFPCSSSIWPEFIKSMVLEHFYSVLLSPPIYMKWKRVCASAAVRVEFYVSFEMAYTIHFIEMEFIQWSIGISLEIKYNDKFLQRMNE